MSSLVRGIVRRLAMVMLETAAVNWAYKNRKLIQTKLKFNSDDKTTDQTRPLGDRYVGPKADREPSPFESASAEEALPLSPKISAHQEDSMTHVRIDAVLKL